MKKNIGNKDRIIRLIAGLVLIYLAINIEKNIDIIKALLVVFGVICIIESIIGYCYYYKLFKINTGGK